MITDAGKRYIAEQFGIGNCWVYSGLSWTTYYTGGGSDAETGGTAKITARLTNPAVNERVVLSSPRTGTYRTSNLTAANGGNVVSLDDVRDIIIPNDGYPAGENQYCVGAPPVDKGYLKVNTSPTGASVMVSGVSCGTTPVTACEVGVGSKTVTITKSGYTTVTRYITITAGATYNLGTITLTPTATGDKGWVSLCTLPAGADIYIDGAKVPWAAPLCPAAARNYEVTARVMHTVKFVLANYKDKTINFSIGVGGTWQAHAVLEAVAGPNTGTLRLTAHDAVTGQELYARPSIAGTTMEEKLLTPLTINLSIPAGATSKEYEVGAIHPGYEKEVTTVILKKTNTPANPLVVDLRMKESKVWREVRIVEKMPRVAWVTGISIPSIMQWGINYTGWIKFIFTLAAKYRAHLDLFARPSGWDGRLDSLPTTATARISTDEETLTPWPDNEQKLDWAWTVPSAGSIPEGTYVVVCVIEYEE